MRYVKAVMIAIFTVSWGFSAYIFGKITTSNDLTTNNEKELWIAFWLLIAAGILAIGYACVLGYKEDRRTLAEHLKRMEVMDEQIVYYGSQNPTPLYPPFYPTPMATPKWYHRIILWLRHYL